MPAPHLLCIPRILSLLRHAVPALRPALAPAPCPALRRPACLLARLPCMKLCPRLDPDALSLLGLYQACWGAYAAC